jgi:hypothetical protein
MITPGMEFQLGQIACRFASNAVALVYPGVRQKRIKFQPARQEFMPNSTEDTAGTKARNAAITLACWMQVAAVMEADAGSGHQCCRWRPLLLWTCGAFHVCYVASLT